ncbi:MAG: hypothetical protein CMF59_19790 [Leptospiraceae bacterium]|nr:hypothetical protein [Leptospiraceae bacterium]
MLLSDLHNSVKDQFLDSVNDALDKGIMDAETIRMLIVSPTEDRSALIIQFSDEYEEFLYLEFVDTDPIGYINISPWLDACDALDSEVGELSDSESAQLKRIRQRHEKVGPAISLETIPEGFRRQRMELLRETMLQEVQSGLRLAAAELAHRFHHVVPIVTKKLVFENEDHNDTVAFCHELGQGPFYHALVHLPEVILTYPFLKFTDKGFVLFYPEGSIQEEDDNEISSVTSFEAEEMRFARMSDDGSDFVFRMKDQFQDWKIDGGHIHEEWGDFSEEELLNGFRRFLQEHPELEIDLQTVPHPVSNRKDFEQWMDRLVEFNLKLGYDQFTAILDMGEEAVEAALAIMPDTYSQKDRLKIRRAQRSMETGNFARALKQFQEIQNLSSHYDPELLYLYSVTGEDHVFEKKLDELQSEGAAKGEVKLPVWLHRVRKNYTDPASLQGLQQELSEFVQEREGYRDQSYALFNLAIVFAGLGKIGEALATIRRVDFTESFLSSIASAELAVHPELVAAWVEMKSEREEAEALSQALREGPEQEEIEDRRKAEESDSELEFVFQSELEHESKVDWADFFGPRRLLRARDETLELLAVDLDAQSVQSIHSIPLEADAGDYSFQLSGNHLFVLRYNSESIVQYDIQDDQFELVATYSHKARNSRYRLIGVHDGHLYASAGPRMEIFAVGETAEVPLSQVLYKLPDESVYFIAGYKNIIYAGSRDLTTIDVSDPFKPQVLSSLAPFSSSTPHEIQFWDHFLLADYLYDIKVPASPRQIDDICRDHAPLRVFGSDSKDALPEHVPGLFSCGDDQGMLRQILHKDGVFSGVRIWQNVMDQEREFPKRSVYPVCSMLCGDRLVAVNRDEIFFFERFPAKVRPTMDGQSLLESSVKGMLQEYSSTDSSEKATVGGIRIILESYGAEIKILPAVSIPSVGSMTPLIEKHLFYSRDNPDFVEGAIVRVDDETLAQFCRSLPELQEMASGQVFVSISHRLDGQVQLTEPYYLEWKVEDRPWIPARTGAVEVGLPTSTREILLTKNANLWKSLREAAAGDETVLQELLDISLEDSSEDESETDIPLTAVRAIARIPDAGLVHNIFMAGVAGHLGNLSASELRDLDLELLKNVKKEGISADYLYILLRHLWEIASSDLNRSILKSVLQKIGGEMAAILAFRLEEWENEDLKEAVKEVLENPYFNYYSFRGEDGAAGFEGPDLSMLPVSLLAPHRDLLRNRLKEISETRADIDSLVPFWQMLTTLGEPPALELVAEKNLRAKEYLEGSSFGFGKDSDDEPESPDAFSVRLERRLRVQEMHNRLLRIQKGESIPLFSEEWKPEPFRRSWVGLWSTLLDYGEEVTGDRNGYQKSVLQALENNLEREEETFNGDLTLSLRFLDYVLTQISEDPSIAEASSSLFAALDAQKHRLPENENFRSLKHKGLLSILQSAWNDVKEKNFSEAHRKCDAILAMDPSMGQAYFLKGRLIWLEEGIQAYLVQAEDFYKKATGDRAGLARLYNMTGCAYDELKDPARAIPFFEKAAAEVPEEAMYIANIAECYYKLNKPEKALQYAGHAKNKGANSEIIQKILANSGVISGVAE